MLGDFAPMALSATESYKRLAKWAGIIGSICFVICILSTLVAAALLSEKRRLEHWVNVGISLLWIVTITCTVIWLFALIRSRFKARDPEV